MKKRMIAAAVLICIGFLAGFAAKPDAYISPDEPSSSAERTLPQILLLSAESIKECAGRIRDALGTFREQYHFTLMQQHHKNAADSSKHGHGLHRTAAAAAAFGRSVKYRTRIRMSERCIPRRGRRCRTVIDRTAAKSPSAGRRGR